MLRRSLGRCCARGTNPAWTSALMNELVETASKFFDERDPFLFVPFDQVEASQPAAVGLSTDRSEYTLLAETYPFPERYQVPTSLGTVPSKLYYRSTDPEPIVYLALNDHIDPSLWLPCKPNAAGIHRTLSEFASVAVQHRDRYHGHFETRIERARNLMRVQNMPDDEPSVLRYAAWMARDTPDDLKPLDDFNSSQEFFLGEWSDPEKIFEKFDLSPHLFALPHYRNVVDLNTMIPAVNGPGVATALYRTVHSKSLVLVQAHLSADVRLPARDPEAIALLWKDVTVKEPPSRIPVFARVVWPDNKRMCGGGGVVARFNETHRCEFARDMPVDAVAAVHGTAAWAERTVDLLGVRGMRDRVAQLAAASMQSDLRLPAYHPSTADIPSPEYTDADALGMHLQYAALLNDPTAADLVRHFADSVHPSVRMGCAKAALLAGDRALFRSIVAREPQGRNQHYMTKLARKRKTRDLTDAEPRMLDEQFEFPAPIYTKSHRIDPTTEEGRSEMARLRVTGRARKQA
uniref:Uncharacterized protein n=2 Tax=Neobodo designis TaxID=312471 RepID=A0A7S1MMM6_NEODS